MGRTVVTFGVDKGSSVHVDNKNRDILILGEGLKQGLDDTILTAEAKYPINYTQSNKSFDTVMETTVSCLLMLQKYINSKQKTLKEKIIRCVLVKFQKIL